MKFITILQVFDVSTGGTSGRLTLMFVHQSNSYRAKCLSNVFTFNIMTYQAQINAT